MISLELAKELKAAGLEWVPVKGDFWAYRLVDNGIGVVDSTVRPGQEPHPNNIWLPRLDQLLAEIEARGWWWWMSWSGKVWVGRKDNDKGGHELETDTPEDAAAKALLWILSQDAQKQA